MCHVVRKILSNELGGPGPFDRYRSYIEMIGCASLRNFLDVLVKTKSSDYDVEIIQNQIDTCPICQLERSKREELVKNFSNMSKQEVEDYRSGCVATYEEIRRICGTLNTMVTP